jgi:hypothetical protein
VTVALVYGRVTTQEIEVLFAFNIPNMDAFAAAEDNRKWMIIVGSVTVL